MLLCVEECRHCFYVLGNEDRVGTSETSSGIVDVILFPLAITAFAIFLSFFVLLLFKYTFIFLLVDLSV